jgi:hypothetical protein
MKLMMDMEKLVMMNWRSEKMVVGPSLMRYWIHGWQVEKCALLLLAEIQLCY